MLYGHKKRKNTAYGFIKDSKGGVIKNIKFRKKGLVK